MRTCQISNLDRIAHIDLEARLRRLLDTHTRLRTTPHTTRPRGLHWRRRSRAPVAVDIIILEGMRVRGPATGLLLQRHGGTQDGLLLLGRHGRRIRVGAGGVVGAGGRGAEGSEGVVDGFETGGLGDQAARGAGWAWRRGRGARGLGCCRG